MHHGDDGPSPAAGHMDSSCSTGEVSPPVAPIAYPREVADIAPRADDVAAEEENAPNEVAMVAMETDGGSKDPRTSLDKGQQKWRGATPAASVAEEDGDEAEEDEEAAASGSAVALRQRCDAPSSDGRGRKRRSVERSPTPGFKRKYTTKAEVQDLLGKVGSCASPTEQREHLSSFLDPLAHCPTVTSQPCPPSSSPPYSEYQCPWMGVQRL